MAHLLSFAPILVAVQFISISHASKDDIEYFHLIERGRPVLAGVSVAIDRLHLAVSYEEPRWRFEGQWKPEKEVARQAGVLRLRSPQDQPDIPFPPVSASNPVEWLKTFLAGDPNRSFALVSSGAHLAVVPRRARDAAGAWVPTTSLLDHPLTMEARDRSGREFLDAFCAALGQQEGVRVIGARGGFEWSALERFRTKRGATGETARRVLRGFIDDFNPGLYWQLTYSGADWFSLLLMLPPPLENEPVTK